MREPVVYVLGAGPSFAAALFGCAKLYEQPQFEGVPQELEEWAHLQYFMVVEGTPVVFIAPPGLSRDPQLRTVRSRGAARWRRDLDRQLVRHRSRRPPTTRFRS